MSRLHWIAAGLYTFEIADVLASCNGYWGSPGRRNLRLSARDLKVVSVPTNFAILNCPEQFLSGT
jgi:hypothetical protein